MKCGPYSIVQAKSRRLGRVGAVPQPFPLPWQIDIWDAMVAPGAAPYLLQSQTVLYSRTAMSGVDLYNVATGEWADWGALNSLSVTPRAFSEAEEAKARDTRALAVVQSPSCAVHCRAHARAYQDHPSARSENLRRCDLAWTPPNSPRDDVHTHFGRWALDAPGDFLIWARQAFGTSGRQRVGHANARIHCGYR